ncbi:UNKNOWN [Stylonychia lemnae]|uniref:Uncharacterized protein n=1 Tax=Stylonychia lemnae TaxID=5949 RepID=A0A077ZRY2_STYLE|nr:UNKNOWN [Stylonychia lemnae]|eukprot:CDW72239.1 UNKNOWN [Stylonychia lemnae]
MNRIDDLQRRMKEGNYNINENQLETAISEVIGSEANNGNYNQNHHHPMSSTTRGNNEILSPTLIKNASNKSTLSKRSNQDEDETNKSDFSSIARTQNEKGLQVQTSKFRKSNQKPSTSHSS